MCVELKPIPWGNLHPFNTVEVSLDIWSAGDSRCHTARHAALMNALKSGKVEYTTISGTPLNYDWLVWKYSDDLLVERESFIKWAVSIEDSHRVSLINAQRNAHA